MNSKLLVLASLLMASLLISGCISQTNNSTATGEKVTVKFVVIGQQSMVVKTTEVAKGANAFEEMKKTLDVNYSVSSYGPFITAINGASPSTDSYWALYVDGNYSNVGINAVTLDKNMAIEWRMEKIQMNRVGG